MKVIVSVINDLSTDQRVHKVCTTLHSMGYKVLLIGRRQRQSLSLAPRRYYTRRMFLIFEKGPMFYAFFQIRLFLFLLLHKADVLVANDLDTLLPNYLVSVLKRIPLVYDTHELFCEVPELQRKPLKKRIWKGLERRIFPKLSHIFTVNDSIAGIYSREYGVPVKVVRNVPRFAFSAVDMPFASRREFELPEDKKIILLQGAGINMDRGAEEAVLAMEYVDGALLLIIGDGDVIPLLRKLAARPELAEKVRFVPKLPFAELKRYTQLADIGLTLDKDTNINYRYSLPNKLFDYIQAEVPVMASNLIEVRRIVEEFEIGCIVPDHNPHTIGKMLSSCLGNDTQMKIWKENTKLAGRRFCWENEENELRAVYEMFLSKSRAK
jgi:glycosyltransferase involved in cell wall biosynthesis